MDTGVGSEAQFKLKQPDGREHLGVTRITNQVVAWIAAFAALQTPGIHAMYQPAGRSIERILRQSAAHRAVKVQLREDASLDLDLWVVVIAGQSVPEVGAEVQRRVADAIERMLGLELHTINVHVSEVVFA